jgi:serine protease AprX
VTITVHDSSHLPVSSATVSVSWSGGFSGSGSCTTNASGQCSVTSGSIRKRNSSTAMTVINVTHAVRTYNSSNNHDPDGDSNGTTITVTKP